MNQCEFRLTEIKSEINSKIKLANICYIGIKSDYKTVNIQSLLKQFSKEISIPTSEKFRFFDFQSARENIKNSPRPSEEYKKHEVERIDALEKEFKKFKSILTLMKNSKNSIECDYICGVYKGLKIVYSHNIKNIINLNEQIKAKKNKINKMVFEEGINECCKSFEYQIRGELKRHNINEEKKRLVKL